MEFGRLTHEGIHNLIRLKTTHGLKFVFLPVTTELTGFARLFLVGRIKSRDKMPLLFQCVQYDIFIIVSPFEENDSHAKERAREEAAQKDVMREAMEMLDSGLLLRAILEVLDRVRNEEPNFHKRNNYQMLMEDLEDFYNRQMSIEAFEEEKRHAKRDRFCR